MVIHELNDRETYMHISICGFNATMPKLIFFLSLNEVIIDQFEY